MNLLLHIGVSKTGTTSIQRWLSETCSPVRGNVFIPDEHVLPGTRFGNHLGLPLYTGAARVWETRLASDTRNKLPPELRDLAPNEFRAAFHERLVRCIQLAADRGCDTVLLSAEHLSERLDLADIARFSTCLESLFGERTLLVYLREQSRAYLSLYCETVKYGSRNRFPSFVRQASVRRMFDYSERLREWEACGWIIRPRLYHEADAHPEGWDLIHDFEQLVWPASAEGRNSDWNVDAYRRNATLPAGAYAITSYFNYFRISPRLRTRLLATFARSQILTKWFLYRNAARLHEVRRRSQAGNRQVANRYFGRSELFCGCDT